jgi:hypothetical protein
MKSRPEVLPLRLDSVKERTYEQIDSFAMARNTEFVYNTNGRDELHATQLNGAYPRALRQLNLIQARHSIAHMMNSAAQPRDIMKIADAIRLNVIFKATFEDSDPFENYNAKEIMSLVGSAEQLKINIQPLVLEFAQTIGTSANAKLLRAIKDVNLKTLLKNMKREINRELKNLRAGLLIVNEDRHVFELHEEVVKNIGDIILAFGTNKAENTKMKRKAKTIEEGLLDQHWCKLMPAYPKLELTHNGRMNRKRRAHDIGKSPKYLQRLLTDPSRRIFTKKSKSLGGIVVIDCSGSMSLSNDEIESLVSSASGSTVWAYSSGCRGYESENTWLLAHNGKRVRVLPEFHGGNGVDLPALAFAKRYRRNKTDMMIWISDGMVTGNGNCGDRKLARATAHFIRKNDIHHVADVNEAIELMREAQRGRKRKRKISRWEMFTLGTGRS